MLCDECHFKVELISDDVEMTLATSKKTSSCEFDVFAKIVYKKDTAL